MSLIFLVYLTEIVKRLGSSGNLHDAAQVTPWFFG